MRDRGKDGGAVGDEFTGSGSGPRVTPRQAQILDLAATGLSDKQIAQRLRVSHRTVRTHFENLFVDQGIRNRSQAIAIWSRTNVPIRSRFLPVLSSVQRTRRRR